MASEGGKESTLCRLTNLLFPKKSAINIVTYSAEKPLVPRRSLFDRLSAWPVFLIAEHSIFLCLGALSHEEETQEDDDMRR